MHDQLLFCVHELIRSSNGLPTLWLLYVILWHRVDRNIHKLLSTYTDDLHLSVKLLDPLKLEVTRHDGTPVKCVAVIKESEDEGFVLKNVYHDQRAKGRAPQFDIVLSEKWVKDILIELEHPLFQENKYLHFIGISSHSPRTSRTSPFLTPSQINVQNFLQFICLFIHSLISLISWILFLHLGAISTCN